MALFTQSNDPAGGGPIVTAVVAVSEARVKALAAANQTIPPPQTVQALLDTGASGTCIDPTVLQALSLQPTGSTQVLTPSSGPSGATKNQYDVGLLIPGGTNQPPLIKTTIPVIESDLKVQGIQALIGRDVLSECVLIYNGRAGFFTLAF